MLVKIGADFIPVVFLTTDTQDAALEDTVEVEGQEELEAEANEDTATEDGTEAAAHTEGEEGTIEAETEGSDLTAVTESSEGEETDGEVVEGQEDGTTPQESLDGGDVYTDGMLGDSREIIEETAKEKDPLLSSPFFAGGISLGVLVAGGVLGFLLAKKKIKKGIEIYEDN